MNESPVEANKVEPEEDIFDLAYEEKMAAKAEAEADMTPEEMQAEMDEERIAMMTEDGSMSEAEARAKLVPEKERIIGRRVRIDENGYYIFGEKGKEDSQLNEYVKTLKEYWLKNKSAKEIYQKKIDAGMSEKQAILETRAEMIARASAVQNDVEERTTAPVSEAQPVSAETTAEAKQPVGEIEEEWEERFENRSVEEIKKGWIVNDFEKATYQKKIDAGMSEKQAILETVDESITRDSTMMNDPDRVTFNQLGEEVIDKFNKSAPDKAFVKSRTGQVVHGVISNDIANMAGIKPGEIRVYNSLYKHLSKVKPNEKISRLVQIKRLGYNNPIDFIDDVMENLSKIQEGSDNSLLLIGNVGKNNTVAIKLEDDGGFYRVSTLMPRRKIGNKKTIWEAAIPLRNETEQPAIIGPNGSVNITPSDANVNSTFYQTAFAGSGVDYDRPSLEAIGSGEGNQKHGWGLYYALLREVAEGYRKAFIRQEREAVFPDSPEELAINAYVRNGKNKDAAIKELQQTEKEEYKKFGTKDENVLAYTNAAQAQDYLRYVDEDTLQKGILEVENSGKGQVHEVDIPENPYLLDEQKLFSEQSEIVKQGITDAVKEIAGENAQKQLDILKEKDYLGREIYNTISRFLSEDENHQTNTASEKAASQLLEKHGIKGITYDGKQDGRCFVIFNPADVKVIQKFYQTGDEVGNKLFSPTRIEKSNYISDLREAERFEGNEQKIIRLGKLPAVYKAIGIPEANVNTNKKTVIKDAVKKHAVPMNVVENLPELYADPIMVFQALPDSKNPNAYVAVLDAKDKNGLQIIAAISPTNKKDGYHFIASFYGKSALQNMINKANKIGNIKYIKDKSQISAGEVQYFPITLTGSLKGNVLQKSDIVNSTFHQTGNTRPQGARGSFTRRLDTGEAIIELFKTADASTIIHELGHFFLDDMRRFADDPTTAEQLQAIYRYVGSADGNLSVEQHEYFARSFEAYMREGKSPNSLLKRVFDDFKTWLKRIYATVKGLNVKLDDDIRKVFDEMLGGKQLDFAMQQGAPFGAVLQ